MTARKLNAQHICTTTTTFMVSTPMRMDTMCSSWTPMEATSKITLRELSVAWKETHLLLRATIISELKDLSFCKWRRIDFLFLFCTNEMSAMRTAQQISKWIFEFLVLVLSCCKLFMNKVILFIRQTSIIHKVTSFFTVDNLSSKGVGKKQYDEQEKLTKRSRSILIPQCRVA